MRRSNIAEWILSLVTAPERASSTVGDLLETSATRSAVWFWASLIRTTGSFLWRDLATSPVRIVLLALNGFLKGIGIFGVTMAAMLFLIGFAHLIVTMAGISDPKAYLPEWVGSVLGFVLWGIFIPFAIGDFLAHKSPGRELAPCVAYAVIAELFGALLLSRGIRITIGGIGPPLPTLDGSTMIAYPLQLFLNVAYFLAIWTIPLFAGAIVVRRRSLRTPTT